MKFSFLNLFLLLAVFLTACEGVFNKPEEVAFLDISDAYYIGVDDDIDVGSEKGMASNLFKITSSNMDSDPVFVDFLSKAGEVIGSEFIYAHSNFPIIISKRYLILFGEFRFKLKGGETHSNALLVNNETGALYDLGYEFDPTDQNRYLGARYYQQDKYGNIYFLTRGVKRLVFHDIDNVDVEYYIDYPGNFDRWFVDADGNVYFNRGSQVKLASGGIFETGTEMVCFGGMAGQTFGFQTKSSSDLSLFSMIAYGDSILKRVVQVPNILFESFQGLLYYPDLQNRRHIFISTQIFKKSGGSYYHLPGGILFNETDSSIYRLKFPEEIGEFTFLGLEDNYLWVKKYRDNLSLYTFDLKSINLDMQSERANFNEFDEFKFPISVEIQELRFNELGFVEFSAYDLRNETTIKGFVSMSTGMVSREEDSLLGSNALLRIR